MCRVALDAISCDVRRNLIRLPDDCKWEIAFSCLCHKRPLACVQFEPYKPFYTKDFEILFDVPTTNAFASCYLFNGVPLCMCSQRRVAESI